MNLSKEEILELYGNLKNDIESSDINSICNICKLPTIKSDRVILNCNHVYHYNCIKNNITKMFIHIVLEKIK